MKFSSALKLNHIFQRLYRSNGHANGLLVLYARKNRTDSNRVGITVSKKLGKANVRNRIRRRLREVYPNILKLSYDNTRTRQDQLITGAENVRTKTPLELFGELYEQMNNRPMGQEQTAFVQELIEDIWEGAK